MTVNNKPFVRKVKDTWNALSTQERVGAVVLAAIAFLIVLDVIGVI